VRDELASLFTERVGEQLQRRLVTPLMRPRQAARVVTHNHRQVSMPAPVTGLVDPDPMRRTPAHGKLAIITPCCGYFTRCTAASMNTVDVTIVPRFALRV